MEVQKIDQIWLHYLVHSLEAPHATRLCLNHKSTASSLWVWSLLDIDMWLSRTARSRHMSRQSMHVQLPVAFHSLHILTSLANLKLRHNIRFPSEIESKRERIKDYFSWIYDRFIAIIKRWAIQEAIKRSFRFHKRLTRSMKLSHKFVSWFELFLARKSPNLLLGFP